MRASIFFFISVLKNLKLDIISLVDLQDFFKKHGVAVMNIRELFDFIVQVDIDVDKHLEEVICFLTQSNNLKI